jgi:beta-galactosidase/beta-glucuronidase
MSALPHPEYPRPQFVRTEWLNLNGEWEYVFDHGTSGRDRRLQNAQSFDGRINVPFCPESRLSGVAYTDFIASIWYLRKFTVPREWAGKRVLLHFGAVDFATEVWVNGKSVGMHKGGYSSFAFEITDALVPGENTLIVCADDDVRVDFRPVAVQSDVPHHR